MHLEGDTRHTAEKMHDIIAKEEYRGAVNTIKAYNQTWSEWLKFTKADGTGIHVTPVTKVYAFLAQLRERHKAKKNKVTGDSVAAAKENIMKLHRIQGCPMFLPKEVDYLQTVVTAAKTDSVAIQLEISKNTSQLDKHSGRITDADRDHLYCTCVSDPHSLKGLSGQVMIGLDLQLGTRGVALEQTTWFHMYHDVPSNAQNIKPQAFDMIAFGVAKDKTNKTGKVIYKGIARHAKAGWDVFASLAELLAWEVANGFQLLNDIKHGKSAWTNSTILFPGEHQERVGRLRGCFQHITKQLPKWQKWKQLHLMRHTVTVMLAEEGANPGNIDTQMDWVPGKTQRAYMQDPIVSLNEQAILAGFTKGSAQWHQHHHLGRADVCVPAAWVDALIPGLSFLLANSQQYSSRAQETLKCINLFVQAYWQAVPIKMLLYQNSYMKKQLPGVLEVMTSSEYTHFADRVRQAELDSMHELGYDVPELELWAQNRGEFSDIPAVKSVLYRQTSLPLLHQVWLPLSLLQRDRRFRAAICKVNQGWLCYRSSRSAKTWSANCWMRGQRQLHWSSKLSKHTWQRWKHGTKRSKREQVAVVADLQSQQT